MVSTHRIYGYGDHSNSGRERRKDLRHPGSGPGVHDFPAFVIAALRASLVRLLHFMTVGTFGEGRSLQKVMGAPLVLSRVRVTSFWIGHANSFNWPQIAEAS
jgi:hypothetical protein